VEEEGVEREKEEKEEEEGVDTSATPSTHAFEVLQFLSVRGPAIEKRTSLNCLRE
jgi:hypothetical protein